MSLDGMTKLFADLQDYARLKRLESDLRFNVVFCPKDGPATCTTVTQSELREQVQRHLGAEGQVFVFLGLRWNLTRGPLKFLVPPQGYGERVALFDSDDALAVDPTGDTSLDQTETLDALPSS